MLEILIEFLNSRIASTGYINKVNCLAEKIEAGGKVYPAMYVKNEYKQIDLDLSGSISYWRKNGEISYSDSENSSKVGQIEYTTSVPLKLVCFVKKGTENNTVYFADSLVEVLKSALSSNTAILKTVLKAKKCTITATKYDTDGRNVSSGEYSGIEFTPRYTHAYFSIDFEVKVVSNQNCYNDICDSGFTIPSPSELVSFCDRVNNCLINSGISVTANDGIVAYPTGGQANATILTANYNIVDTVITSLDSVKMNEATSGKFKQVTNNGVSDMNLYPKIGERFQNGATLIAVNVPIQIDSGNGISFVCYTDGIWRFN